MLQAVIQGIESFWIQNFPIPSTVIETISRMCRKFLWAGAKPKVAWTDICTPKDEGGLGLKDCKTWNKAMLFRILWDIHSMKNNLWIKWIHVFYLLEVAIYGHGITAEMIPHFLKTSRNS